MLLCVGAGIAVGTILNIHQVAKQKTYFYLRCDRFSVFTIVTDTKFMLIYVCGICFV
jgi:hypothetical protein